MDRTGAREQNPLKGTPAAASRASVPVLNRILSRGTALWLLIGALAVLFGLLVVAIAIQAIQTRFSLLQWLVAILFVLPIGGALVGLLWYRRILGGAEAERARSERALAQSEAKFRGLIMAAPDGIFVVDSTWTIQDVNPAGMALIGRDHDAIVGHKLVDFIPKERGPIAERYLADRLAGNREKELYDGTWLGADGRRIEVQLTSQSVQQAGADPYLVVSVRDVTEQREIQRKLLESERWVSMGRLASFVAHEINTPLTNISLLTASISRRVSDADVLERLKKITIQGRIAANITSELLKFSRPGAINPVETNLVDLVHAAIEQTDVFRKPGVELQTELGRRPVLCEVDPLRIQEVFVNLLKNAYEATPTGRVRVHLEDLGANVAVAISDTGSGIPPEVQQRIFEAFFTTKKKGEGTGLGLALSRNFVASHGGDITVISDAGTGSTFTVLLPKTAPGPRPAA